MTFKVAIDMDGVIAQFTAASFRMVKKLWDIDLTMDDMKIPKTAQTVWERMTDKQRSKYTNHRELYADICPAGFFAELDPCPGAIEAVEELFDAGYEIYFLTKTLNWDRCPGDKADWLKKYFPNRDYTIIMVDSVQAKHIIDVDVIIDDDPRVLEGIHNAAPICIHQPWNEESRNKIAFSAPSIVEAVSIVYRLEMIFAWWKEGNME